MVNCQIQVAGALAGLASRSWAGVLKAIGSANSATTGPCKAFWDETAALRPSSAWTSQRERETTMTQGCKAILLLIGGLLVTGASLSP